jgi:hypothetical protein
MLVLLAVTLMPAALRAAEPLWLVADRDRTAASHALIQTRVERALTKARSDYATSHFKACARRLDRVEQQVQWHLRGKADLAQIKRLNLWLGLCRAVADEPEGARAAFARAARLPGADPDPSLFPPAVMALFRAAKAPRDRCVLQIPETADLQLDGRAVTPGARIAPGEHYVIQDGRSARRRVGGDCGLDLSTLPLPALHLDPEEAESSEFLETLGRAAGVERIALAQGGARVTVSIFDVGGRRFVQRNAPLGLTLRPETPATERRGKPAPARPWYRRWWIWALVGTAVAAAVVVPVVLTQTGSTRYEVGF